MLFLVVDDVLKVVVVAGGVAGGRKVRLGHHADAFFVEDILEVLEGQGILENVGVRDGGLTLVDWVSGGNGSQEGGAEAGLELHVGGLVVVMW